MLLRLTTSLLCVALLWNSASAIPIPNGLVGDPEVECGEDSIIVVWNTEQNFEGKIFVKGFFNDSNCVAREQGRKTTSISVNKNQCGVVTRRSADPAGLFITVNLIVSFHPTFITKVDQGFAIECFYMQAMKSVTYPISVSMISLQPIQEIAEMPRCRYEVFVGDAQGPPATTVKVGDALYHKWTCESTSPNLWCMTVYGCYVDDGRGTRITILDDQGCAVDKFILQNLEYQTNLMAGREAHAFKFADDVAINFQCSIRLDIQENAQCPRPTCPPLARRRRELERQIATFPEDSVFEFVPVAEVDVRSRGLNVLDSNLDFPSNSVSNHNIASLDARPFDNSTFCVAIWQFGLFVTLVLLVLIGMTGSMIWLCTKQSTKS